VPAGVPALAKQPLVVEVGAALDVLLNHVSVPEPPTCKYTVCSGLMPEIAFVLEYAPPPELAMPPAPMHSTCKVPPAGKSAGIKNFPVPTGRAITVVGIF
jgi:hypothetical protein